MRISLLRLVNPATTKPPGDSEDHPATSSEVTKPPGDSEDHPATSSEVTKPPGDSEDYPALLRLVK